MDNSGIGLFGMYCMIQYLETLYEPITHASPKVTYLAYYHKRERTRKKNLKRMGIYHGREAISNK